MNTLGCGTLNGVNPCNLETTVRLDNEALLAMC
ncbi:MAG: hypothetical protein BWX48_01389 [Verrucomicrobia bacterium ADurb.Bin006]|nr:MAG: hypothetical protein BWX48_01389 [Verrucomicrobia bacterium ADurb.Bin006]